ncbi:sucrase/ferredoxin domain protein [Aspergillus bombycis]|uniref:Sucrase/ferredoxin domain protein n=1 Tax=Aspergillus bombycis TaxID=109264 RepID=A0A1F7ZKF2_9EURO|nr:sucrase/ferredoxin domain protein [Aspergillus bombycis]OGM39924.1 sucrase/ferredoxin domain protein [Aspergillus bombycis]
MFRSLLTLTKLASPEYIFPTVDPKIDGEECRQDCADCTVKWPSKVKVDNTLPMYGYIKQFHAHVLVATGKTDWVGKVEQEKGSLMEAFKSDGGKSKQGRIMVSASNLTPPESENGQIDSGKTTVLLLPSFTFVDGVAYGDVRHVVDTFIDNPKQESRLSSRPCPHDYVVLLCSHQRRDARCGITAPLIKKELERHLRGHGLYRDLDDERPGGVGIYFVSHVGGHKFAANVLIYRKKEQQMIWLGRVKPEHCEGLVKYTILQGKVVHPDSQLRGGFDRMKGLTSW